MGWFERKNIAKNIFSLFAMSEKFQWAQLHLILREYCIEQKISQ
jgi:hypothetical protein